MPKQHLIPPPSDALFLPSKCILHSICLCWCHVGQALHSICLWDRHLFVGQALHSICLCWCHVEQALPKQLPKQTRMLLLAWLQASSWMPCWSQAPSLRVPCRLGFKHQVAYQGMLLECMPAGLLDACRCSACADASLRHPPPVRVRPPVCGRSGQESFRVHGSEHTCIATPFPWSMNSVNTDPAWHRCMHGLCQP